MNIFHVHINVIKALVLREIHTLYGHTTLGYLWAIIQTGFSIGVFWGIRVLLHAKAPHGLTTLTYLVAGFFVWNVISDCMNKCMNAIDGNRALLTFPQILPLDVMIARVVVVVATQMVSMTILLLFGAVFGYYFVVYKYGLLMFTIILSAAFGLGLGACLGAISIYFSALQNIVPMVMRITFFASGVFFSVSMFSKKIGDFLLWNPIMQLIELMRSSMSSSYQSPYVDMPYLVFITISVLTLGLLLERYTRKRQQS